MNQIQIEQHIKIRSEALAKQMAKALFETFKADFLKQRAEGDTVTLKQVLSASESNRMKQVYEAIANNPNQDRHKLLTFINAEAEKTITQSTISGRLGDLIRSGLIEVTGEITGEHGRPVSLYGVTNE